VVVDESGAVAEVGVVPIILAAVVVLVGIVAISLLVVMVVLSAAEAAGYHVGCYRCGLVLLLGR
jgi:hypothetical protein